MKRLYPNLTFKTCIIAASVFMASAVWAQSGANLFQGFGSAGLRDVNINQITTSDFLCDSSYFYLNTDSISDLWVLNERAIYEYDNRGRESKRNVSAFKEDRWIKKQQISSFYISDFLKTRQESAWNEIESQWIPHTKHLYDYNYNGLIYEIKTFGLKNSEWIAGAKTNYSYNTEYLVEIESRYAWNEELKEWSPDSRNLYVYNDEQDLSKDILQVWVDSIGDWVNKTSETFTFNSFDDIVTSTTRVWDNWLDIWINNSISSIEYNEEGQPQSSATETFDAQNNTISMQSDMADYDALGNVNQLVTSYWDDESGSWDVYQKQINFWSEYIHGNLNAAEKEIRCVFSNPYSIGLPWYCESLKPEVLYTLRVYDIMGRTFYTDQFLGSSTFRITQHLEPGYYIFEISGGLDKHYEKVYVKS